ncbi:MAG: hypothetical protein KatS3mg105_0937 [Gemmatales bacterium]|nr:MAG: hypothetical protein KatS3mg105_0937 [Gemmatales bacterium]
MNGKQSLLKAGGDFGVNPSAISAAELEMVLGAGRHHFYRRWQRPVSNTLFSPPLISLR